MQIFTFEFYKEQLKIVLMGIAQMLIKWIHMVTAYWAEWDVE